MLSAKKVLLHQMSDKRWTTKDKVVQYKGLVPLYQRDKKMHGTDETSVAKSQKKEHRKISKDLVNDRQALNKCIHGDRQSIRICLGADNRLLAAYKDLPIENIIEHIHQDNFKLRKTLDRLMYKIRLKTEKLIKLKLDVALYQDILAESQTSTAIEIQAKEITAQVQDAILKQDGAIRVGVIYKEIIQYMKKDRVYFDAVLNTLQFDILKQNECMVQAIKLGQLATEQRAERSLEYNKMMDAIRRQQELWKNETQSLVIKVRGVKRFVRKSKENLVDWVPYDLPRVNALSKLRDLEEVIQQLLDITSTTHMLDIFPCLEHQKKNASTLNEMLKKLQKGKNTLIEKVNHANLSYVNYLGLNDEPLSFKQEKRELEDTIKAKTQEIQEVSQRLAIINDLCTKLDLAVTQLDIKCDPVNVQKDFKLSPVFTEHYDKYGFLKTFDKVTLKITYLIKTYPELDLNGNEKKAERLYANLVKTELKEDVLTKKAAPYLQFTKAEDPEIPTREGIKEDSLDFANKAKAFLSDLR